MQQEVSKLHCNFLQFLLKWPVERQEGLKIAKLQNCNRCDLQFSARENCNEKIAIFL